MRTIVLNNRSEGLPERDMESLGVMGWGLVVAENSSAAAVVAAAVPWRHQRLTSDW